MSRGGSTATKSAANRWRYASSKAGQKIGLADNPGRKGCIRSGASHLHLAVQIWGDARLTTDADLTLPFARDGALPVVALITSRFPSRTADPLSMALQHRMILITASNGVDVDLSLAVPGYEDRLFERAVAYQLEPGKTIWLCSAEDLIIHKAVAGRPQDIVDIQGVIYRQGRKLDRGYIRIWLGQFSQILEMPEILERFEQAWRSYEQGEA